MDEIISLQKRHMYFCAAAALLAVWFFVLSGLGLRRFYPGVYTVGSITSVLLLAYGFPGFFKFRKRAEIAGIIRAGLLAHWRYDEVTWLEWLSRNRKYAKVDLWNGKGFVFAYALVAPFLLLGFAAGPVGKVITTVLVGVALSILPIVNGLIYRRQRRRPEVFLSPYGAFVATSLFRFFNRKNSSLITEATVVSDESYPYIELELTQFGGYNRRSPFSGYHTTKRRVLIPYDSVPEAEGLLEQLTARYDFDTAMAQLRNNDSRT